MGATFKRLKIEPLESRAMLTAIALSDAEQWMIELLNHTRANTLPGQDLYEVDLNEGLPPGTISKTPKPPLAPNAQLSEAARRHSQDMLDNFFFDHINLQGEDPGDRILKAGYPALASGENLSYLYSFGGPPISSPEVDSHHWNLFGSPGHRETMFSTNYREIGIGFAFDQIDQYQTQVYGRRSSGVFLTGVAYADRDQNDFYSIGEGLGDITIVARSASGSVYEVDTGPSGGYSIALPAGTYQVSASGPGLAEPIVIDDVVVHSENVKVDFLGDSSQIVGDANEPNDSAAEATSLGSGDHLRIERLTLHEADDRDLFHWTSVGEGTLWISVFSEHSIAGGGLRLLTPDGQQVVRETSLDEGQHELFASVATGDEFLIEVDGNDALVNREYTLRVVGIFPPRTHADGVATPAGTPVELNVLANDDPVAGQLNDLTLAVHSEPAHGSVELLPDGRVRYSPDPQFIGIDTFSYEIRNNQSFQRAGIGQAYVHVGVTPGQNAEAVWDVNGDGIITPRDALLVINKIARESGPDPIAVDMAVTGPDFYDVNGDGVISPRDALLVINELSRRLF